MTPPGAAGLPGDDAGEPPFAIDDGHRADLAGVDDLDGFPDVVSLVERRHGVVMMSLASIALSPFRSDNYGANLLSALTWIKADTKPREAFFTRRRL
ncbi:hypothetical protein AM571_PB00043 (plasmid) [Rhizobium etli 8C-3]|jgi:hypothetical protein|uniref:Uncharacterized protein n=2 Tax=Rhizobium TaxID=379 RepID=A0A1L5PAW6_RHIET|nr:hypothetical protein AM571_PB00043 [Rhizobium etli 8C-3]ARO26675.1 hypothetical protein TAL182_PC00061 [Rhizobium sp. TAL182]ARQ60555.1 hypothetical protein Kim5_PA00081 [Rhizobium sp. Kim5]EGE58676.1 hypothetical protein RHECNPAF_289008 [Rhizobium etli CNPAF512]TCU16215.1 hypothetical protein EV130_11820 [Rhizobium azibense]